MSISSAHADGASRSAADRHVRDFAFFFVTLPVLFTFDKKISFPICCSGQPDFKYFHSSIYWKYYDIITFSYTTPSKFTVVSTGKDNWSSYVPLRNIYFSSTFFPLNFSTLSSSAINSHPYFLNSSI